MPSSARLYPFIYLYFLRDDVGIVPYDYYLKNQFANSQKTNLKPSEAGSSWRGGITEHRRKNTGS